MQSKVNNNVPAQYMLKTFRCQFCGVVADQDWNILHKRVEGWDAPDYQHQIKLKNGPAEFAEFSLCECISCGQISVWVRHYDEIDSDTDGVPIDMDSTKIYLNHNGSKYILIEKQIEPAPMNFPPPHKDMPEKVKKDYIEAGRIVDASPTAAAALLRRALERFAEELDAEGRTLNEKIIYLFRSSKVDPSLKANFDALRFMGNHAVHAGMISDDDDSKTAWKLFEILNHLVKNIITLPAYNEKITSDILEWDREN